jgi:hypothetical protein
MSENNNETKNYKKPLFNHTKENYQIMEQVIKQSKEAGFDEWQRQEDQTLKELAEYLLFFGPFIEEIFYHDFATRFFQCKEYTGCLKHLQEMVVFKNPFDYLNKFLIPVDQLKKIPFDYAKYPPFDDNVSMHIPVSDYEIMDQVITKTIIKTKQAGYIWIQEEPGDTVEHLTYWLLRLRRFPFNIFTHDFAQAFFQCKKEEDNLKHLQEMVLYKNPFEYLNNFT